MMSTPESTGAQQRMWSMLYMDALSEKVGLSLSEVKCITVLSAKGALTAGELTRLTGLTGGAITNIVAKLESRGLVIRRQSKDDARRAIIEPQVQKIADTIEAERGKTDQKMQQVFAGFSAEEQQTIFRFIQASGDLFREETYRLRGQLPPADE